MEITTSADAIFSATAPSVAQYDNLAGAALGRAIDAFTGNNYDVAIREFKRTIALSPYSNNALNAFEYMANALESSGKTSEAMKTLQQAIKVFPSADGFNLSLGNLLFSEGRYQEALKQYVNAVRKNPTVSQNYYSVGQGYLALAQYDEAETQFKKVIQLSPNDSSGYYALGQTYRVSGRYDEAREQLQKALTIKKDLVDAHYELGMIYNAQQQTDKVQTELDILSEEDQDLFVELQNKIFENAAPRFLLAYTSNLNLESGPGTQVSTLDSSLETPGAMNNFTVNFIFDKQMDPVSIQNVTNWSINRSTNLKTGGPYNWGLQIPSSEVSISPTPAVVHYDPTKLTAQVTFTIGQNSSGNGTIDLSHLVFKFQGTDVYGNSMDDFANEYNYISKIV